MSCLKVTLKFNYILYKNTKNVFFLDFEKKFTAILYLFLIVLQIITRPSNYYSSYKIYCKCKSNLAFLYFKVR